MTDVATILSQLEGKIQAELKEGHPYEALQYVQSFVARKKKAFGQESTSTVVFHGAKQLIANNASSCAGTLLKWFIEDGAGTDFSFSVEEKKNYCDVQRVLDLLSPLSSEQAYPVVDIIYDPLHLFIAKLKTKKSGALMERLNQFEAFCARVNLDSGVYYLSFKSYVRLGKMPEASNVLLQWSSKGYPSERALFFARGVLFLLSEGKVSAASELHEISKKHVQDNISQEPGVTNVGTGGGPESAPLAVWHLATILVELAVMPPMPRVDKTKLFGILFGRYGPFLVSVDSKLLEMMTKAGEQVFGFSLQQQQQARGAAPPANPMAMLQGLLGNGAGAGGAGKGGMDMEKMMSMMSKMQGGR